MIDILIKSFNRPFYLDRCLFSIYKYVEGNFSIKVLDDGTPEIYLNKIKEKYPKVHILKSNNYKEKQNAIKENLSLGTEIDGFNIPVNFWIETVKNSSDYFIITEDDVWFTNKIQIESYVYIMKEYKIYLLLLGWIMNNKLLYSYKHNPLNNEIISINPGLFIPAPFIMDIYYFNRYKVFSILKKLKLVNSQTRNRYWILNSMMMGLYNKSYWLQIWKKIEDKVDERQQLFNASLFYKKNKSSHFISRLEKNSMKTTFISASTNSHHNYGCNFDVNLFNHILNEKWLNNEFNILQNFPNDFSESYFANFLSEYIHPKISTKEWKKWIDKFKEQYRKVNSHVPDNR